MSSSPEAAVPATARRHPQWWRWAVGLGLLLLLAFAAGPRELGTALQEASRRWVALVVIGSLVWLVLGALNVWLLLRRLAPVRFWVFLDAYLKSWLLSLAIPGQLGDATQVLLLRSSGLAVATSGAAYLLDKALSLLWLGAVAVYGIAYYTAVDSRVLLLGSITLVLAAAAAFTLLRGATAGARGRLGRVRAVAASTIDQILCFRQFPWAVARNFALTIFKWAVGAASYWAAFRAVGSPIDIRSAATIPFLGSLVGYIPVTVAGAGTMELTALVLFGRLGLKAAKVLSAYLIVRGAIFLALFMLLGLASQALTRRRA